MKIMRAKLIWTILLVLIFLNSVAAVIIIDGGEANVGRLLYADVSARPGDSLTSAVFEFSFDSTVASFREVKPAKGAKTVVSEQEGGVTVCYLGSGTASEERFTLVFFGKGAGDLRLSCCVRDCADNSAQWLEVEEVRVGELRVTEKTGSVKEKKKREQADGAAEPEKSRKTEPTEPRTITDLHTRKRAAKEDSEPPVAAVSVLIASSAGLISGILFLYRKIIRSKPTAKSAKSINTDRKDG